MHAKKDEGVYVDAPLDFLYLRDKYSWLERHRLNCSLKNAIRRTLDSGGVVRASDAQIAAEIHKYYKVPPDKIEISKDQCRQELPH